MSCVVELLPDAQRLIPMAATNLSKEEHKVFPLQIDLVGLQQLVTTYAQIVGQVAKEQGNGNATPTNRRRTRKQTSVEEVDEQPTKTGEPSAGDALSTISSRTGAEA